MPASRCSPPFVAATAAYAQQPHPWQMTFQPAATDMMAEITWFEHYTLWFIVPITLLVLVLLAYCIFKFRAERQPDAVAHQPQHA